MLVILHKRPTHPRSKPWTHLNLSGCIITAKFNFVKSEKVNPPDFLDKAIEEMSQPCHVILYRK
jgi:hypothetical protein